MYFIFTSLRFLDTKSSRVLTFTEVANIKKTVTCSGDYKKSETTEKDSSSLFLFPSDERRVST